MSHRCLDRIAAADPNLEQAPEVLLSGTRQDQHHAERRCQQRGISLTKIRIALAYGRHDVHHHLERWTLAARDLKQSPYSRFEHDLNGLQLIGRSLDPEEDGTAIVAIKTCKWNYRLRRH